MIALPIVFLLLAAGLQMGRSRRGRAFRKVTAILSALAAWMATLAAVRGVPAGVSVSAWRPEEIFRDRIALLSDIPGWTVGFVVTAMLVSVLLTDQPHEDPLADRRTGALLAYAAVGLFAIQAGNLLTLALSWALLDLAGLALTSWLRLHGQPTGDDGLRLRLLGSVGGIVVACSAVLAQPAGTVGSDLANLSRSPVGFGLVFAGVAIRLAASGVPISSDQAGEDRPGAAAFHLLLPQGACLAALGRVGAPTSADATWFVLAVGILVLLTAGVRWVVTAAADVEGNLPYLGLSVAGLAAVAAAVIPARSTEVWSAGGALVLLAGLACVVGRGHRIVRPMSLLVGALAVAGFPFTVGNVLVSSYFPEQFALPPAASGGLGILAAGLVAGGVWESRMRAAPEGREPSISGRAAVAASAWVFLAAGAFGTYAFLSTRLESINQVGSVASLTLLVVGVVARRRWSGAGRERAARTTRWLDPRPLLGAAAGGLSLLLRASGAVAGLMEGEAALLWIYVLVVALGVAASVGR